MKKYLIIIGNFGSGKTELALNIAFEAAETKKVTFVDLDIVNPYFRSTERKAELEAAGIRLLSPSFTNLGVEPVISEFAQYAKEHELDENFIGTIRPIKRYMHRDWDSYTKSGL